MQHFVDLTLDQRIDLGNVAIQLFDHPLRISRSTLLQSLLAKPQKQCFTWFFGCKKCIQRIRSVHLSSRWTCPEESGEGTLPLAKPVPLRTSPSNELAVLRGSSSNANASRELRPSIPANSSIDSQSAMHKRRTSVQRSLSASSHGLGHYLLPLGILVTSRNEAFNSSNCSQDANTRRHCKLLANQESH